MLCLQVLQQAQQAGHVHLAIVSDANSVFIQLILAAHGLQVRPLTDYV